MIFDRNMFVNKKPKNKAEGEFWDFAKNNGYEVSKRGWPDFFVVDTKTGKIACVEVKPRKGNFLKESQSVVMNALAEYGVPCYLWNPETGFRRIGKQLFRHKKPSH